MSWIRSLGERLRALLKKRQVEAEMAEELQYHLERETEKNIQAGLSPREARRLAHARFGGVERVKEQVRDERGVRAFEDLALDVRYAFRSLLRSPGFTLVTGNYFSMLGVQAHLGRMIAPEDHVAPGSHPVVVLGYRYWEQSFGRDPWRSSSSSPARIWRASCSPGPATVRPRRP